jgi:hypothetical protein
LITAKPNGFGAGTRAHAARATSHPVATAAAVRRRTRTPRQARVQRSVRRAPWSLCVMSVGPTPSHVVRARWPRRAARALPLAGRPLHVVAGPCPCRASPCRAASLTDPSRTAFTCVRLQKPPLRPTRAPCPHTEPPLQPPVVPTASSTLRPLAPPTRVAPACARVPSSSPFHLLLRPSHQLAGVFPPAVAVAGLRRGRPPVPFPPQVSAQIEHLRTLDHFPPLTRPSPPPASPESGQPRHPLPHWTTL